MFLNAPETQIVRAYPIGVVAIIRGVSETQIRRLIAKRKTSGVVRRRGHTCSRLLLPTAVEQLVGHAVSLEQLNAAWAAWSAAHPRAGELRTNFSPDELVPVGATQ
jgi:hypothetical protein